jgi:hypothetical protein
MFGFTKVKNTITEPVLYSAGARAATGVSKEKFHTLIHFKK